MKNLKTIFVAATLLIGTVAMAQDQKTGPVLEKQGELIKGTFFYENGNVQQEGTYKDGRLHGKWISYCPDGRKTALAHYKNGEKTGKWFFWIDESLTEVDYDQNQIAEVITWTREGELVTND